jgi:hypothetical protein
VFFFCYIHFNRTLYVEIESNYTNSDWNIPTKKITRSFIICHIDCSTKNLCIFCALTISANCLGGFNLSLSFSNEVDSDCITSLVKTCYICALLYRCVFLRNYVIDSDNNPELQSIQVEVIRLYQHIKTLIRII